jgi:hypothetical protein
LNKKFTGKVTLSAIQELGFNFKENREMQYKKRIDNKRK